MNLRKAFDQGLVAGVFLMVGANAIYWLVSSWHPETSTLSTVLVILQLLVSIGVAGWFLLRRSRYAAGA